MNAKEYLSQARFLDVRIDAKIRQVTRLNELATKCTSTISDMPRNPSPSQSTMEEAICKIIDLEAEINRDIDRLVDLKREISNVIKNIDSSEEQVLLKKRYLCFESWEQIALDMGYSVQHIFRLHDKSIKKILVPMKDESK